MPMSEAKTQVLLAVFCILLGMVLMCLISSAISSPSREVIHTSSAPEPIGPYSQAVRTGGLVFTSGQIGIDPKTGNLSSSIDEQTGQVMKNLQEILHASGHDLSDVVSTRIYLTNLSDFAVVNEIYSRSMGNAAPARSTVQVVALPKGALVEIEMTASGSP